MFVIQIGRSFKTVLMDPFLTPFAISRLSCTCMKEAFTAHKEKESERKDEKWKVKRRQNVFLNVPFFVPQGFLVEFIEWNDSFLNRKFKTNDATVYECNFFSSYSLSHTGNSDFGENSLIGTLPSSIGEMKDLYWLYVFWSVKKVWEKTIRKKCNLLFDWSPQGNHSNSFFPFRTVNLNSLSGTLPSTLWTLTNVKV